MNTCARIAMGQSGEVALVPRSGEGGRSHVLAMHEYIVLSSYNLWIYAA